MGGGFPMELSKGPVPCVARGVPTPFLDSAGQLHPAISSPLPPWGSNTWARCAGPWRTWRQTRRPLWPKHTTSKITRSFIRKGVLLVEWRNMGRPPGDGFSPSRSWVVSGLSVGRACALRLTSPHLPLLSDPLARCASTWRTCRQTRRPLWPEPTTAKTVSYTHLTLPTMKCRCRSRWSPYH